ncbi:hypothetical protein ABTC48_20170, partial [Acinetobacter baumannii]
YDRHGSGERKYAIVPHSPCTLRVHPKSYGKTAIRAIPQSRIAPRTGVAGQACSLCKPLARAGQRSDLNPTGGRLARRQSHLLHRATSAGVA